MAMPMPTGAETASRWFTEERLAQAVAPSRVRERLRIANDIANHIDENDSDLRALALVVLHCTEAMCIALDSRVRP